MRRQCLWRNYLRQNELDWLDGHQVQRQTVFPATGYIAMAVEAYRIIGQETQLIQVRRPSIDHSISFTDATESVEIIYQLTQVNFAGSTMAADFSCSASSGGTLKKKAPVVKSQLSGGNPVTACCHQGGLLLQTA